VKLLAILNSQGVVHNWMNALCPVVKRVHEVEFRGGREIHRVVTATQALVFGLPGCEACWGNSVAFRTMLEVQPSTH
jgi:hypothetical protein